MRRINRSHEIKEAMSDKIINSVIDVIAKQKQIDHKSITVDSTLDELGVTSLDAITIVFDIEEKYDIEVPSDLLDELETVQDIVNGISKLTDTS